MELLTCPCCGGMAEIEITPNRSQAKDIHGRTEIALVLPTSQVRCLNCGLKIKRPSEDLAGVISAWNRRVKFRHP